MKTLLFLIFILITLSQDVTSQRKDFFPMAVGSSFNYSYNVRHSRGYNDPIGGNSYDYTDSWKGSVSYFVTDSSLQGDTLTLWSILEKDSLVYQYYNSGIEQDSSLTVNTYQAQLKEMTGGLHPLYANAKIWIFQGDASRYRNTTSNIDIVNTGLGTMTFKEDSGLVSVQYFSGSGGNHYETYQRAFYLLSISSPILYREANERTPLDYSLDQSYPNPFNPTTVIPFSVPKETQLTLRIYDLLGRIIDTIVDDNVQAGHHIVIWNASNKASGTYYCVLQTEQISRSIKLVLIK